MGNIKKCPNCQANCFQIAVNIDDHERLVWTHGHTEEKCMYRDDGIQVKTELLDKFMMEKFQELILSCPEVNDEVKVVNVEEPSQKIGIDLLKEQLVKGSIDVRLFDEIKKRLEND